MKGTHVICSRIIYGRERIHCVRREGKSSLYIYVYIYVYIGEEEGGAGGGGGGVIFTAAIHTFRNTAKLFNSFLESYYERKVTNLNIEVVVVLIHSFIYYYML